MAFMIQVIKSPAFGLVDFVLHEIKPMAEVVVMKMDIEGNSMVLYSAHFLHAMKGSL
jgi:hypothetical protein